MAARFLVASFGPVRACMQCAVRCSKMRAWVAHVRLIMAHVLRFATNMRGWNPGEPRQELPSNCKKNEKIQEKNT